MPLELTEVGKPITRRIRIGSHQTSLEEKRRGFDYKQHPKAARHYLGHYGSRYLRDKWNDTVTYWLHGAEIFPELEHPTKWIQ